MHEQKVFLQTRRRLMAGVAASLALPLARPASGSVTLKNIARAFSEVTVGNAVRRGRVRLEVPQLVDNGNLVSLKLIVDSPMTQDDHVRSVFLVAEKNPRPLIARFFLGPHAGRAELATRIRLAGTQSLAAVAEMSDGSFWSGVAEVTVTLAACVEET